MILFIDGPQGAGKSTLIDYLKKYNFKSYKFDFSKYSQAFKIKQNSQLKNYQIGKDFATLYWLKELANSNENIVIDRGVMSSIYYSHHFKRMNEKEIITYFDLLEDFKEFKFLFLLPKKRGEFIRNKEDGFDSLDSNEYDSDTIDFMITKANERDIDFDIFYNNFTKSIEENGERLKNYLRI